MREIISKPDKLFFVSFFVFLIVFSLFVYADFFSRFRFFLSDGLQGGRPVLQNIVIVKIDDVSINRVGRWPWDRDVFASLLEKLSSAKVVGVDVSFFEKSDKDDSLAKTLASMDNVVLASEINDGVHYRPVFGVRDGYVNVITGSDGVTRSFVPVVNSSASSFAFEIFRLGWNAGASIMPGELFVNFALPGSFVSYSAVDVLDGNIDFSGRIVLVGATAPDLHDDYQVPASFGVVMSGVEIHANILQNFILDDFVVHEPVWLLLLSVFVGALLGAFVFSHHRIYYIIPLVVFVVACYFFLAIFLFSRFELALDLFFFPSSLVFFTVLGVGVHYFNEKRHNAYLVDAFGRYISKSLLKQIIANKHELKLGGKKTQITVFFSDIRGFTSLSEKLDAEQLVHLLNEYLSVMTGVILEHNGTLDKFIGDAIMAFWNAPLPEPAHAVLACRSAIAQVVALKKLKEHWREKNLPVIDIGCGLNTGEAVIGNMGSSERFDYTAIGDNVNLASRLEGLTKTYGVGIIISEETFKLVKNELHCRKLDAVKVKGKKIPVLIYELCVVYDEKFVGLCEAGLEHYFAREFSKAIKKYRDALKSKPDDLACKMFVERCSDYLKHPPAKDWDGSFEMKTK